MIAVYSKSNSWHNHNNFIIMVIIYITNCYDKLNLITVYLKLMS